MISWMDRVYWIPVDAVKNYYTFSSLTQHSINCCGNKKSEMNFTGA
jgi:hypothetical protein